MDSKYDVIIAGGGLAGLNAALHLDTNIKALLITKEKLDLNNSSLAQGGIAAVVDKGEDDFRLHIADTLIAGGYKNNLEALEVLVTEGPEDVLGLINYGVEFDADPAGKLHMTLEAGHSRRRILHHKDATGLEVIQKLITAVRMLPNIDILENTALFGLEQTGNGFSARLILENDGYETIYSRYCILATGGIGRIYKYTTNSRIATGDGISIAGELGAKIRNIQYIQFHPTAFAADAGRERFLISEAVRGEGAVLLNCDGRRFMFDYDPRGELAPRDVVSRHVIEESMKTNSEKFYLDITHKGADFIKERFPNIYARCLEENIDITKDRIPVYPCQHYLMGGIQVDIWGRTSVNGLYAAGECSNTGVHGKNRLASNSLLEALVFSRRAALDISGRFGAMGIADSGHNTEWAHTGEEVPLGIRTRIRSMMQESYFVFPDREAARKNLETIEELKWMLRSRNYSTNKNHLEVWSIANVAGMILKEVAAQ